jgi:rare lipoprotein A
MVKRKFMQLGVVVVGLGLAGCAGSRQSVDAPARGAATAEKAAESEESGGRWRTYETGVASWYGGRWHGRKTANGERYDQNSMTAAHKKLPFHTRVRVTNLRTGKSCIVRINNRGPYVRGRVIDLSVAAAKKIGSHSGGLSRVKLEVQR